MPKPKRLPREQFDSVKEAAETLVRYISTSKSPDPFLVKSQSRLILMRAERVGATHAED